MDILNIPTRSLIIFANALSKVIDSQLSEDEYMEYVIVFHNTLLVLRSRKDFAEGQVDEPTTLSKTGRAVCKVEVGFLLSDFSSTSASN